MRTLEEQCLYFHRYQSLAEARRIIHEIIACYNTEWLIERLGHQTPVAARPSDGGVSDEAWAQLRQDRGSRVGALS